MRGLKRDMPARVHTGRAVKAQLAAARTPELRHGAFLSNLGDGFFVRGGLTYYSDGGPAQPSHTKKRKKPPGRKSRAAARRDHARRRKTPGGAYLP